MPILKKGEIKVRATAYGTEVKSTGYVFYSYDKKASALFFQFRNQNGEPTDIASAKIHLLMILEDDEGKEFIPGQEDFEIISKPGGKAKFVLPEMLLSYQGKVTGYINLDFEDGSHTDEGQFSFRIRRSMITRVLPAMGDKYVQDFEDIKERVEQAEDSTRNDFKDSVERVNKDYEAWKSEQEEEQTGFESDFADWKNTQETKQTNFESDTNETINGINTKVGETQTKISDLEKNLDVEQKNYFSVEAWKERASTAVITNDFPATKIRLEANTKYTLSTNIPKSGDNKDVFFAAGDVYEVKTPSEGVAIDEPRTITTNFDGAAIVAIRDKDMTSGDWWIMLNKGETSAGWVPNADDLATKQELDVKVDKTSFDNFTEHGFLSVESGFENYDGDNTPTSMQYIRVGNLMHIYGAVTNQKVLNKDSDHLVAKLPERFKVFMNDTRVCQASGYDLFTTRINESERGNLTNQIFIIRLRGGNGVSKDFEAGRWLNISLTCGVEVVD